MMYSIKVIREIDEETKQELDAFSEAHWGEHVDSLEEVANNFFAPADLAVVAYAKEEIVGLLFVYVKHVLFNTRKLTIGGIGGVVVNKALRHQGIATKMLKKALMEMKKRSMDAAMLCTEIDKLGRLYSKVGFKPLGRPYYFYDRNGVLQKEGGGMISKLGANNICEEIISSSEKINVGQSNF